MSDHVKKRLLEKYSASEVGTWRILGEDPNCDWGGHHHQPDLGTVSGSYINAIEYALTLPGFFTWGSGGDLVRINHIINVDKINIARIAKLKEEYSSLQKRMKEIEEELNKMGH